LSHFDYYNPKQTKLTNGIGIHACYCHSLNWGFLQGTVYDILKMGKRGVFATAALSERVLTAVRDRILKVKTYVSSERES